ncbi:MAG: polymer-forming cytoskeletal protein [Sideroxydans sp.]|nr:polymer-forming cytoskeletal protein [Sideroxydans sp.]
MFSKKPSKPQNRIDSLIGAGTIITGDLNFSGGMRIDGQVKGNVIATPGKPSTLVLSELSVIDGDVNVTHLVANGMVNGVVTASEYLELQSKARINGDVNYQTMEIQLGAVIDGRLLHNPITNQEKVVLLGAAKIK